MSRGGKREGAGRKALAPRKMISARVSVDVAELLAAEKNKSKLVDNLLRNYFANKADRLIRVRFCSTRPYNKLYVGIAINEVDRGLVGGLITRTDHFDDQHDGKWYMAVASVIQGVMAEYNCDVLYRDSELLDGVIINSDDDIDKICDKVLSQCGEQ